MEEIWKDIKGWEGYYQYSNFLRIKSLDRIIFRKDGIKKTIKGKILPVSKSSQYARVFLVKNGETVFLQLHKFFAEQFIPNPENRKYVNHKNGDKQDYSLSNLEWVTKGEDLKHAYRTGLRVAVRGDKSNFWGQKYTSQRIGGAHPFSKKVLDTKTGELYDSISDAAKKNNILYATLYANVSGISKTNRTSLVLT